MRAHINDHKGALVNLVGDNMEDGKPFSPNRIFLLKITWDAPTTVGWFLDRLNPCFSGK